MREFYFKLLHRIVVTKRELHLFGIENDMLCTFTVEKMILLFTPFLTVTGPRNFSWKL